MADIDFGGCVSAASFWKPDRLAQDEAWIEHIPFAFWLMDSLRPKRVVELGTFSGNSFFALCQAAKRDGISARLTAVDTWEGDAHVGTYGENVYADVLRHRDAHFGDCAELMRCTFDEARTKFSSAEIDLLHIDGLHTYEAVRHDFESWRDVVSDNGIVLFHDVSVRHTDFGVWKLWSELSSEHPSFQFPHCNGLGVLALGKSLPDPANRLFEASVAQVDAIRSLYARLGQSVVDRRDEVKRLQKRVDDIESSRSYMAANAVARLVKPFR